MLNIMNKIKDFMQVKRNKTIVMIGLIIVCFFVFNLGGLLGRVFTSITSIFSSDNKEVKQVIFKSDGYDSEEDGSFKVVKQADWTSTSTAQITYDIDSVIKYNSENSKDVVLIIDTAKGIRDTEFSTVKADSIRYATELLSANSNNRIAIISNSEKDIIETDFTNDINDVTTIINNLSLKNDENTDDILKTVHDFLDGYERDNNKDLVVMVITGVCSVTRHDIMYYKILKATYPYIKLTSIQYEVSFDFTGDEASRIYDYIYRANGFTLYSDLLQATYDSENYKTLEIVEYIDNDNFKINSVNDIKVSIGDISLVIENNQQKIIWNLSSDLKTGKDAQMIINLSLVDSKKEIVDYFRTTTSTKISALLSDNIDIGMTTSDAIVLKHGYVVTYNANAPSNCSSSIDLEEKHFGYETVAFSSTNLICDGYIFKGWEAPKEVVMVNNNNFIMPNNDIEVKGVWTKLNIRKSMEGTVWERPNLYETIAQDAVFDNIASEYVELSTGIDFNAISSDTNGKGVYTIASTKNDKYPIHYFRGAVTNNHVIFAGFCWEIVRTTETGGVKLIYDGIPNNGICNNSGTASQLSNLSAFSNPYGALGYSGYMRNTLYTVASMTVSGNIVYGNTFTHNGSTYTLSNTVTSSNFSTSAPNLSNHHYTCFSNGTSCSTLYYIYYADGSTAYYISLTGGKSVEKAIEEQLFSSNINSTNSNMKTTLENWYKSNLLNYASYLEDTVWCNDRSIYDLEGWNPNGGSMLDMLVYSTGSRLQLQYSPSLDCVNELDRFTVNSANGNGALTYPIGLLNGDEVAYAGGRSNVDNSSYYLYTGQEYRTMSPHTFGLQRVFGTVVKGTGGMGTLNILTPLGVRPVISLKENIDYTQGNGTEDNPYIIDLSS